MDLLKDKPIKLFFRYLLPGIGGILVYSIYSFVDMIAVGHGVGPMGTAATSVILPLFQIPSFVSILCGIGGSVLIGAEKGRGNKEKADYWFTVSLIGVSVLIAVTWGLTWFFRKQIFTFFGANEEILPYAMDYGQMIILGFPFFTMAGFLPFILRNDSNPDLPLISSICGGIVNSIGDYVLVFPLRLGMFGAGLATLIGSVVQCAILLSHFLSKKRGLNLVKPGNLVKSVTKILPYGFGSAFIEVSTIVSTVVVNKMIMKYSGLPALTVYGFMQTVVALAQFLFLGIGQAAQPIISENYGALQKQRVKETGRLNIITNVATALALTFFSHLCPITITNVFVMKDAGVLAVAPKIIRLYTLSLPLLAFNTAVIINLQSVSKDTRANIITLLRGVVLNTTIIIILPALIGEYGIWWGIVVSEGLVCFVSAFLSFLP